MNSRAASASTSRKVRQNLVRLLFGGKESTTTTTSSLSSSSSSATTCNEITQRARILDHSRYSYAELRTRYLERLQELHPDKNYHQQRQQQHSKTTMKRRDDDNNNGNFNNKNDSIKNNTAGYTTTTTTDLIELKEAWDAYEKLMKMSKTVGNRSSNNVDGEEEEKDRNFTMFGVGCSFSDNEAERRLRNEITDQACRGWFSAGSIAAESASATCTNNNNKNSSNNINIAPLLDEDDDMFVTVTTTTITDNVSSPVEDEIGEEEIVQEREHITQQQQQQRPSLVDQKFRPRSSAG